MSEAEEFKVCTKCPQYEVARNGFVRHVNSKKPTTQRLSVNGYSCINVWTKEAKRNKHIKVHRLVAMAYIDNPDGKGEIDHKDGNKLNNCVDNLRWATRSENCSNKPKRGGTSNLYRGVYNHKGKFRVGVAHNNKNIWLGVYPTAEEGAKKYNEWIIENNQQEWRKLNEIVV